MSPLFICLILYQYYQVNGLATDVRLTQNISTIGGLKPYEGVIEVLVNGTWGTIIRVDSTTAKTICKILGHGFTGFAVYRFWHMDVPLLMNLECEGTETSIQECRQSPLFHVGVHNYAAGVHCFAQKYSDMRLIDGDGPNNGTVNIKMDGRWGLLCGHPQSGVFNLPNIDLVICRTLGYQRLLGRAPWFSRNGDVYISWLDVFKISCNGNETNFNQCSFTEGKMYQPSCEIKRGVNCLTLLNESCTSDDICAAVANAVCTDDICKCRHGYLQTGMYMCTGISQMIRLDPLFGNNNESFLQVNNDGEWTYILNRYESFSNTTAKMICQALGFGYIGFGSWLYTYFVDETNITSEGLFACNGMENSVEDCFTLDEYPQKLVVSGEHPATVLHCFDRWINDVRLTGGQTPYHGNLQVKLGDRWGPVCAAVYPKMAISAVTESVICTSLWNTGNGGYLNATAKSNNTIPWISYLNCEATHTDINQCNYTIGPPHRTGNDCHDMGFVKVRCPNCERGFYGSNCTQCDCHGQGTDGCDMFTGACSCKPGWTDDTCSTDVDECSTSNETCPQQLVCMNQPGYFICECPPGYIAYGSFCEVCVDGQYGRKCSQVCDCELNNVDMTKNNRSCDAVTGICACKSDWTGRRCDIVPTPKATNTLSLFIIISSANAGCLLLVITSVTVCVYKCRKRATKGPGSTPPKEKNETLKTGKSSHHEHTATTASADGADYNTINDCMVDVVINADTGYDIHPDLLERTDRSEGRTDEDDGNDSDGYLKPVPRRTCIGSDFIFTDKHLETDNEGYFKMDSAKRQLPGVPIDDRKELQNPYEGLKDRRQVEHEYS